MGYSDNGARDCGLKFNEIKNKRGPKKEESKALLSSFQFSVKA
jgi:hypothetical protein